MEIQSDLPSCRVVMTTDTKVVIAAYIALVLAIAALFINSIRIQHRFDNAISSRLDASVNAAATLGSAQQARAAALATAVRPCMLKDANQFATFSTATVEQVMAECLGQKLDAASAFVPSAAKDTAAFAKAVGYPPPIYTRTIQVARSP